jgi:hypothetical protein
MLMKECLVSCKLIQTEDVLDEQKPRFPVYDKVANATRCSLIQMVMSRHATAILPSPLEVV